MIHSRLGLIRITPLGDNLVHQLQGIFSFVTRKKVQNGLGRSEEADFAEFLLLMKQLLDINFAKLKDKT
ncbi:unnamed protein product [Symbiodinium natans]|uniref:Uncharacterized protein n=1 Tax=Symbiodinium natans TaxID=878477 RepID=A0A812Q768_9DINO|nr:unnamed protein product [Symbiodinium natans]